MKKRLGKMFSLLAVSRSSQALHLYHNSHANRAVPETMASRILMFTWSLAPLHKLPLCSNCSMNRTQEFILWVQDFYGCSSIWAGGVVPCFGQRTDWGFPVYLSRLRSYGTVAVEHETSCLLLRCTKSCMTYCVLQYHDSYGFGI